MNLDNGGSDMRLLCGITMRKIIWNAPRLLGRDSKVAHLRRYTLRLCQVGSHRLNQASAQPTSLLTRSHVERVDLTGLW